MQFIEPILFREAIKKLGARSPIGAQLSSKQWAAVPVALRDRAFFSATIESVRFLQSMRADLQDFLEANKAPVLNPDGSPKLDRAGNPITALKVGSKAKFIELQRRRAIKLGLGPLDPEDAGTIKDIRSEKRLGLIFDIQIKSAQGYADRQQALDPDILDAFPGVRFIREREVRAERDAHRPFEGTVFLKTDVNMFLRINRDFGVPWGPFGWGCGHDIEDVDRETTDSLGLTQPNKPVPGAPADGSIEPFNENLKASVRNLDPELQAFLKGEFGDQVTIENGEARWNPVAANPESQSSNPSRNRTPVDPEPRAWRDELESLATEHRTAPPSVKRALKERAHRIIEVPEDLRQGVAMDNGGSRAVQEIAAAGNRLIARFVRPSITQNVRVSVHRTNDDRAFYRAGGIYLNALSDTSTAAHEIMHGIEVQNPSILKSAAEFLLRRSNGEAPEKLSALTGDKSYWSTERAFEDDWVDRGGRVYAGKVYSSASSPQTPAELNATEVLTIGIERLLADPLDFVARDPAWFEFLIETIGIGRPLKL